ncbi:M16 family metallopeptidase [Anaerotignum sp. MB30-C6]|uniref:M16 family metallopeptidase n=1 Tax=Anaerotignum sp. MB30-C6 TaxID=3070814 RepID=UPI0027DBE815|nr:pitrilysin family protein [Anaerotignum sp. MB30-C6]WMI81697.1 pitrilysin family protein [Anaerotignum sp. MB30-C6]
MVTIKKLQNGISVALEEISYVRSISFGIWVKNGSRNERPEENGVSHFIEHMIFKGTENRTARQIAEAMDALGGQINAYTTKEYTCYHTRVLDEHFGRALDVMSDMVLRSLFDQKDVERERNVITEEINMYEDAPEELVHDVLQDTIWRNSPLGMPILGTTKTIATFTSESIRNYYEKNYHTENMVLSVAGNFKTDEMLEMLNKALGDWTAKQPFNQYNSKAEYKIAHVAREKDVEQVHTCIAFPGLERENPMKYALGVFNTIFGGGMSSRLFQKVREENGLTYSIYSYTTSFADTGLFSITGGMNPNQLERVYELIASEVEDVKNNLLPQKLIDVTKEQLISNFIIGTESTLNRMTAAGSALLLRGKVQDTQEVIDKLSKITSEDILKVTQTIFDMEKVSWSAVGNVKGIEVDTIGKKVFHK